MKKGEIEIMMTEIKYLPETKKECDELKCSECILGNYVRCNIFAFNE